VKITHRKFQGDRSKEHLIRPHQLKEYRGRWYVLGRSTKHAGPIALGLDRIEKLEATRTKFTRNNDAVADFYETVIGVDTSPGELSATLQPCAGALCEGLADPPLATGGK
jgi:predicted DNA-binding transcriptional regulator YafY